MNGLEILELVDELSILEKELIEEDEKERVQKAVEFFNNRKEYGF
ncbi:MAG: hypothetical protein WD876_00230 [Candidatus Pacearchaeota archaeon]